MTVVRRKHILIFLALSLLSLGGYLFWSSSLYRPGFPLDDAWIHQTYARNLAQTGAWTFQEGVPSAGSTAPLWTLILGVGYLLHLQPLVWVFFIGVVLMTAVAAVGAEAISSFAPGKPAIARLFGGLLIFEWHLVWAAGSGMETLLFTFVTLALFLLLLRDRGSALAWGVLIGVAVWLRPDGITLAGPVLFVTIFGPNSLRQKAVDSLSALAGVLVLVLPYLAFNSWLSGEMLPSTYFAKQAEYAVLRSLPLIQRLGDQLLIPVVGAGAVALPGLVAAGRQGIARRDWPMLAGLCWLLGMAVLYALRLPVTYQHGRYLIPIVPAWFVWGFGPLLDAMRLETNVFLLRVFSRAGLLLALALTAAFYFVGGRAYAQDVAVIESEMVETAKWVSNNLEGASGEPAAAHDIGALGYFGGHRLLDLAGLVSPEVIPFIRDEAALRVYLDQANAAYLITLEGWYPRLEDGLEVVYRTKGSFSPALGGTNMVVYRWP